MTFKATLEIKFIADNNVGRLARWLRTISYNAILLRVKDDRKIIDLALSEDRVVLTKNTQLIKRNPITTGIFRTMLIRQDEPDEPKDQLVDIMRELYLNVEAIPFPLCIGCNQRLIPQDKNDMKHIVAPHISEIQHKYTECPQCHHSY